MKPNPVGNGPSEDSMAFYCAEICPKHCALYHKMK